MSAESAPEATVERLSLDRAAQNFGRKAGEITAQALKRAVVVSRARTIMEHVGVTRIDTGESLPRRVWQSSWNQKPAHVQTRPFRILGEDESEDSPGQRFVIGERQEKFSKKVLVERSRRRYSVVYLRPLLDPQEDHRRFSDYDLAVAEIDRPLYGEGDWDGKALDGTERPSTNGESHMAGFARVMDIIAENEGITLPSLWAIGQQFQVQ